MLTIFTKLFNNYIIYSCGVNMGNEVNLNDELYDQARDYLKQFDAEDLKKYRNEMLQTGKIDEKLLAIFNELLLDKACEENAGKSK